MTAIRWKSVLGLAVLLAAATAAADTVVTAAEVISCRVVSADTNFVHLKLPQGGIRMLSTRDVREIRLSDSSRVAELAARLPGARVTWHADVLDTLARNASPAEMAGRCRDMDAALRECGRSNRTAARLLREVNREAVELAKTPPKSASYLWGIACCGLLGGSIAVVGGVEFPQRFPLVGQETSWKILRDVGCGVLAGTGVGIIPSLLCGPTVGEAMRTSEIRRHRARVNDLVRRVNRVIATVP
jgi:hypothetical protein